MNEQYCKFYINASLGAMAFTDLEKASDMGVYQGFVPSPLHFIIVLEALSREFRTGCPWELLYADDLMVSPWRNCW